MGGMGLGFSDGLMHAAEFCVIAALALDAPGTTASVADSFNKQIFDVLALALAYSTHRRQWT